MSSTAGSEEGRISRSNFRKHEADEEKGAAEDPRVLPCPCPRCGGRMIIIETFLAGMQPTSWPVLSPIRINPHDRGDLNRIFRVASPLARERSHRQSN
jgi:hypothetical protein